MTAPTRDGVLAAQAAHELGELKQLSASLDAVVSPLAGADRVVLDRFDLLIGGLRTRLARIPDDSAWNELAKVRGSIAEIKQEALAFVQGALLRERSLDKGIGVVSERLLAELLERTGEERRVLLALSDNEFFKHTVSMVRGRFPDVTVWNLPVLAHELGHHVAATLAHTDPALREDYRPVAAYLSEEADNEASFANVDRAVALAHLHELFADVYATYVLGAAYPLNMIMLSASPDVFGASSRSHPSWSRRVHTIRAVADVLGVGGAGAAGYRDLAGTISTLWREIAGDSTDTERAVAELQAGAMVGLLVEHAFPRARYDMPERVNEIVIDPDQPFVAPAEGMTFTDVLNAAWRWRIENWGAPGWLIDGASSRALELTQQMIR
jgi:hypothetical protein